MQPNEQVTGTNLLLNGIPRTNWQNVIADTHNDNQWTQESLDKALHAFSIKYCGSNARQEQKRFMKRRLGLPSNYLTATLLNRIEQLNRFLPFLPGNGLKFESDNIRKMLYEALPPYAQNIMSTSDYKWEDAKKSDSEVSSYFDHLLVIGTMARQNPMIKPNQHKRIEAKKNNSKETRTCQTCFKTFQKGTKM